MTCLKNLKKVRSTLNQVDSKIWTISEYALKVIQGPQLSSSLGMLSSISIHISKTFTFVRNAWVIVEEQIINVNSSYLYKMGVGKVRVRVNDSKGNGNMDFSVVLIIFKSF